MASLLFTCVDCLGLHRLENTTDVPPDFDNRCAACRAKPAAPAPKAAPASARASQPRGRRS
jgi:hypothetical protein